jgi:hypothetical protein
MGGKSVMFYINNDIELTAYPNNKTFAAEKQTAQS